MVDLTKKDLKQESGIESAQEATESRLISIMHVIAVNTSASNDTEVNIAVGDVRALQSEFWSLREQLQLANLKLLKAALDNGMSQSTIYGQDNDSSTDPFYNLNITLGFGDTVVEVNNCAAAYNAVYQAVVDILEDLQA